MKTVEIAKSVAVGGFLAIIALIAALMGQIDRTGSLHEQLLECQVSSMLDGGDILKAQTIDSLTHTLDSVTNKLHKYENK